LSSIALRADQIHRTGFTSALRTSTLLLSGVPSPGRDIGAATVVDYHQPDWPQQIRALSQGGVDAAANAVPAGAVEAIRAVRDRGRLVTITSDPPAAERGIAVRAVLVASDGRQLTGLVQLLAEGVLAVSVGERFPLGQAAAALAQARHGAHGTTIVLRLADPS
jgi:NADPH:quinone reductase-like Zn-dependent oxidoreductase